jgi:uncharacterized protein
MCMTKFRVLALDGGGVRGAFGASLLAEIERTLGQPIYRYFDLIVGTSTGGIIAAGLALGMRAAEIRELYETLGVNIFAPAQRRFMGPLFAPKYSRTALTTALRAVYGDKLIRDAKVRLVVPAVNLTSGRPTTFKTPHLRAASTRDLQYRVVDVVLATTAAPTYFEHAAVDGSGAYCDGGLWANNPSLVGYTEAIRIRDELQDATGGAPFAERDIAILSVGTGRRVHSLEPPASAGLSWWVTRLFDVMATAQSHGTEFIAQFLVGRGSYFRIDFDLPDKSWTLDNAHLLSRYFHLGKEAAHSNLSSLRPVFFEKPVQPFDIASPHGWVGTEP